MEEITKKKRGGARPGSGRKKTTHKQYVLYASKEVSEILDSIKGIPITRYICEAILQRAERDLCRPEKTLQDLIQN